MLRERALEQVQAQREVLHVARGLGGGPCDRRGGAGEHECERPNAMGWLPTMAARPARGGVELIRGRGVAASAGQAALLVAAAKMVQEMLVVHRGPAMGSPVHGQRLQHHRELGLFSPLIVRSFQRAKVAGDSGLSAADKMLSKLI